MKFLLTLSLLVLVKNAYSAFRPQNIIMGDNYFAHHVIVVEKSTHQLHLFQTDRGETKLVKTFQIATGKISGDKEREGDFKTPEGIYFFNSFMSKQELLRKIGVQAKIYGAGAFVSNYPNEIDQIYKKKGSGIWLHSTNDETRIEKGLDSRGCAVMVNSDLKEVSKFIELHKTPFIITQNLNFLEEGAHKQVSDEVNEFIRSWKTSWEKKELSSYLSHYNADEFIDVRGNYKKFREYKEKIFSSPGNPILDIDHLTILKEKDYTVAIFIQKYKTDGLVDLGKKILYLKKDSNNQYKIIREVWGNDGLDEHLKVAFQSKQSYFN